MKMNDDTIKAIYDSQGIDGLCKAVKDYVGGKYWDAYRDGYIHGRGIGYQNGKHEGYCKAIQHIMKAD